MPRPLLIRSENHPYHITARCNNKDFFPIPLSEVWRIMIHELKRVHDDHKLAIHAFVLMGNHFHLLAHTPEANLDKIMQIFLKNTSVKISERAGQMNHLWGGRYRWSLIQSQRYYMEVYRYIFQNPMRASLVNKVEDYEFSTITKEVKFPLHTFIPLAFGGREGELFWLNQKYESEQRNLIQLGLKKSLFTVNKKKTDFLAPKGT